MDLIARHDGAGPKPRPPLVLVLPAVAVALGTCLPVLYLILRAFDAELSQIAGIVLRERNALLLANTLKLMARNRRLFVLPQLVQQLQSLIADARGEVTADVTSAVALSAEQKQRLTATLAEKSGKKVKLNTRVDENLIGGMIVKLGSQMIDSSIRSKLASLQNAMKEVG